MLKLQLDNCLTDSGIDTAELTRTLHRLPAGTLPLQAACSQGGIVDDGDLGLSLLSCDAGDDAVDLRIGVFFNEVVGGCNCNDDPVASAAYAVLKVHIALADGMAEIGCSSESTDPD